MTPRLLSRIGTAVALASLSLAGVSIARPALASATAILRISPLAHGAEITLGDLFSGVPASAAKVVVGRAGGPGADAVLEASAVQAVAHAAGVEWPNATGMRRIIVSTANAQRPAAAVSRRAAQALVYSRNLTSGDIIGAGDLVWSDEAVAPSDAPRDAEVVIGQAARRPLRAGAAVGTHDLAAPIVIKRDEMVAVAFQADGIRLVLQGKATADAAVGDILKVENPQSKKMIQALVTGPGEAAVGPQAEAMRAAPYRTALR